MFSYGKMMLFLVSVGFLAGCAASGPAISTSVRAVAAVDAPAYRNGDQWTYQIVRSTGNNDKLQINYRNGKFENDNQAAFDNYLAATVYRSEGDLKPLNFPLTPGKSWNDRYQGTRTRWRIAWRDAELKVIGPTARPVNTKAGQFKAVETQRVESWGAAERKPIYFDSPNTTSVVKLDTDTVSPTTNVRVELELIKFSPGR